MGRPHARSFSILLLHTSRASQTLPCARYRRSSHPHESLRLHPRMPELIRSATSMLVVWTTMEWHGTAVADEHSLNSSGRVHIPSALRPQTPTLQAAPLALAAAVMHIAYVRWKKPPGTHGHVVGSFNSHHLRVSRVWSTNGQDMFLLSLPFPCAGCLCPRAKSWKRWG